MGDDARLSPERRATLRLLAAAAIGAGGMAALLGKALAANPKTGMRSIKGEVSIDGQPAMPGQQVRPGQTVRTGPGGEAIFVIGQDAFLQRETSEFALGGGAGVVALRYITGKVLSVFGKGKKQLETPTATIGIRGTACYIMAETERTYFCLCYGTAIVRPNAALHRKKTVRTKHHESPFYIGRAGDEMMASADVIDHTDDELIMLEELVGRLPPFYGKGYGTY